MIENPHYMGLTDKQGSRQTYKLQANKQGSRQTNMGCRQTKLGSDKQTWERPRFADLAATAELSLAFEKVAANWGSRQSQAKTTSDQKPQTTRAKPQRKEECGAGEGLTISWKAFTWKVEWSHPPGAIGLQRHVHFSQSHISLSSRNTQWNCLPVKILLRREKNE